MRISCVLEVGGFAFCGDLRAEFGEDEVELLEGAGGEDLDLRVVRGAGALFGDLFGDGVAGIDDFDVGGEEGFDGGFEEGVVGAAEDEGVGALGEHVGGVFSDRGVDLRSVEDALFDEFDEFGAGLGDDAEVEGVGGDEAVEFFSAEGGLGGEDSDGVCLGDGGGGFDAGFHADEGDGVVDAEGFDGGDGGGVAGDDDQFGAEVDEVVGEGEDALLDVVEGFAAVGAPGGIADVGQRVVRQQGVDFF